MFHLDDYWRWYNSFHRFYLGFTLLDTQTCKAIVPKSYVTSETPYEIDLHPVPHVKDLVRLKDNRLAVVGSGLNSNPLFAFFGGMNVAVVDTSADTLILAPTTIESGQELLLVREDGIIFKTGCVYP